MGGPKKENIQKEQQLSDSSIALGNRLADQSQQQFDTQKQYQQPLVKFLQSMISGDPNKRLSSAAIPIGQLATGAQQAREAIFDSVPAGAGRDYALAGLKRDQYAQTSGLLNQAYLSAFPTLANIGSGNAQLGLSQLGAGLRSTEAGTAGLTGINNRDAATKSSTLGMIGNLAGGLGAAAIRKI